jgi:hypothetical protein
MDIQEAISKNYIMVLDPSSDYEYQDPTEFFTKYWKDGLEVGLVAKNEFGKVHYRSFSAPKDPKYPEYFTNFVQMASEFDVNVHAFLHSFGDAFLGQDPNYTLMKGSGDKIPEFVCPTNVSFWKYMSTIGKEVARQKVASIVLAEHYFPRIGYCMCRRCRSELKELTGGQEIYSLEEIISDEDLLYKYVNWRSGIINTGLAEIIDGIHSVNPDLPVQAIFPLDPIIEWFTGAAMHLGFDVDLIGSTVNGIIINVMPWSPIYPTEGTNDWNQLAQRLKHLNDNFPNIELSLMLQNLEQEWDTDWFENLAKAAGVKKIFGSMTNSRLFNLKREIHRGVSRF